MKRGEMLLWKKQCERQINRSIQNRLDFGFVYTYKPVLDDAPSRIFDSMSKYRLWCEKNLPSFLVYDRK